MFYKFIGIINDELENIICKSKCFILIIINKGIVSI